MAAAIDSQTAFEFGSSIAFCSYGDANVRPLQSEFTSSNEHARGGAPTVLADGSVLLGTGSDKVVYGLPCGCHVLKLDRGLRNYGDQIAKEVNVWANASDELREILCPITASGDGWIIARRAECFEECSDEGQELVDDLEAMGVEHGDLRDENVGRLDGRPVLVDYGLGTIYIRGNASDDDDDDDDATEPSESRVWCSGCGTYHN